MTNFDGGLDITFVNGTAQPKAHPHRHPAHTAERGTRGLGDDFRGGDGSSMAHERRTHQQDESTAADSAHHGRAFPACHCRYRWVAARMSVMP